MKEVRIGGASLGQVDGFSAFHRTMLIADPDGRIASTALRQSYVAWAGATGCRVLSYPQIKAAMARHGYPLVRSNGSYYAGVEFGGAAAALTAAGQHPHDMPDILRAVADHLAAAQLAIDNLRDQLAPGLPFGSFPAAVRIRGAKSFRPPLS